ncbi:glyco_trans_2-like domain-containing protein [Pseudoscourfieldia marina]
MLVVVNAAATTTTTSSWRAHQNGLGGQHPLTPPPRQPERRRRRLGLVFSSKVGSLRASALLLVVVVVAYISAILSTFAAAAATPNCPAPKNSPQVFYREESPNPTVGVKRKCRRGYTETPALSFLLYRPSYQRDAPRVQELLKSFPGAEFCMLFDNTTVEDAPENKGWLKALGGSHMRFLAYTPSTISLTAAADRLLRLTNAKQSILLLDEKALDRAVASDSAWVRGALERFEKHPRLGVISGKRGPAASQHANGLVFETQPGGGPIALRLVDMLIGNAFGHVRYCTASCETSVGGISRALAGRAWSSGWQAASYAKARMGVSKEKCTAAFGDKASQKRAEELARKANEAMAAKSDTSPFQCAAGIANRCKVGADDGDLPIATFVVQYFRRPDRIGYVSTRLREMAKTELIINNDSSGDFPTFIRSLASTKKVQTNVPSWVIFSPDIHEIRGYNRVSRFGNAPVIMALQDDDKPRNSDWVRKALSLLKAKPKLGMIGGLRGRMDTGRSKDKTTNQNMGQKFGPNFKPINTVEPSSGIVFMYAYKVNAAPLIYRRNMFLSLGMFNGNFSCVGEAGIGFDFEYSLRLWKHNYEVGLYYTNFIRPRPGARGKGGTRSSNSAWNRRRRNENFNNGQLYAMYRGWHHAVGTRMAVQLNKGLRSRGGRGRR